MNRIRAYALAVVEAAIVVVPIYILANEFTLRRTLRYHFFWQWELAAPLVPAMILIYISLYLLMLTPLFLCQPEQMRPLGRALAIASLVGGSVFLLFPAELGFPRTVPQSAFGGFFRILHSVDRPHNLFPSLHVAFSALIVMSVQPNLGPRGRAVMALWLVLICISVVLVRQHHVPDILGGFALAWAINRFYLRRI